MLRIISIFIAALFLLGCVDKNGNGDGDGDGGNNGNDNNGDPNWPHQQDQVEPLEPLDTTGQFDPPAEPDLSEPNVDLGELDTRN